MYELCTLQCNVCAYRCIERVDPIVVNKHRICVFFSHASILFLVFVSSGLLELFVIRYESYRVVLFESACYTITKKNKNCCVFPDKIQGEGIITSCHYGVIRSKLSSINESYCHVN